MSQPALPARALSARDWLAPAPRAHPQHRSPGRLRITQMDNLGSQHVLRNNGFVPCGVTRSHIFTAGMWRDEILWERLLDR